MTRVVTANEYITLPRPQLDWLVPSYIPHPGVVLILGEPKAGKSFLALQVGLHIAGGLPFIQRPVVQAPVLYLQFDTSETVWRQRLAQLQASGVTLPNNFYMLHPDDQPTHINILTHETQSIIRQALDACQPKLVIVDVLRECHNEDEQDSTSMKRVGDQLMQLFYGRTLLLIHHTHKLYESYGPPSPINAARGSSYITGKADAIWLLHNNILSIASRFHHDERHHVKRKTNGLWEIA
jgi:RecA-family ATPase